MLKSALLLTAGIIVGAGAVHGLSAATGPMVYNVYEANVTDEAKYTAALPEAQKHIKENGGVYVAGGFGKAKLGHGAAIGNRYVIISYPNMAAYEKAMSDGNREWLAKNAPADYREIVAEGLEATK